MVALIVLFFAYGRFYSLVTGARDGPANGAGPSERAKRRCSAPAFIGPSPIPLTTT